MMEGNRKKVVTLSMEQRLHVLEDLKTSSLTAVADKYNVNVVTVRRIRRNATKIVEYANKSGAQKNRMRMRGSMFEELEKRVLTWFAERKACGDIVSDALIMKKAEELRNVMELHTKFKVSIKWLARFKRRYDIRLARSHAMVDEVAAKGFVHDLKQLMSEEGIDGENVYDMRETTLLWRALPSKMPTEEEKRCAKGYKYRTDRVTVALCANATGTHKLMPLVINRYHNPRGVKDCRDTLPVIFKTQTETLRIVQSLFCEWYETRFKPSVREHRQAHSTSGKTILLLDSTRKHDLQPTEQEEAEDDFKIMYLPPNTAVLVQPMNQGITKKVKTLYRHKILRKAAKHPNVDEFHKHYTVKDCIDLLDESWREVTADDVKDAWMDIVPGRKDLDSDGMPRDTGLVDGDSFTNEDEYRFMSNCETTESTRSTVEESDVECEGGAEELGEVPRREVEQIFIKEEPMNVAEEQMDVTEEEGNVRENNVKEERMNIAEEQVNVAEEPMNVTKELTKVEEEQMNVAEEPVNVDEASMDVKKGQRNVKEEGTNDGEEPMNVTDGQGIYITKEQINIKEEGMNGTEERMKITKEQPDVEEEPMNVAKERMNGTEEQINITKEQRNFKEEPMNVTEDQMNVTEEQMTTTEERVTQEQMKIIREGELKYLLQRLDYYVSREEPLVQQMFQILRNQLLGTKQ